MHCVNLEVHALAVDSVLRPSVPVELDGFELEGRAEVLGAVGGGEAVQHVVGGEGVGRLVVGVGHGRLGQVLLGLVEGVHAGAQRNRGGRQVDGRLAVFAALVVRHVQGRPVAAVRSLVEISV